MPSKKQDLPAARTGGDQNTRGPLGPKKDATCKPRPRPARPGVTKKPHEQPPNKPGKTVPKAPEPPKEPEDTSAKVGETDLTKLHVQDTIRGIVNSKYTPAGWPFSEEKRRLIFQAQENALAIAVRRQDGRLIDSCVRTFGLLHGQNIAEQQFAFRYATPAPVQEHHVTHSADGRDVADVLREMMRDPAAAAEALALSEKLTAQAFGAGAPKPDGNA